ncbi:hypothetical protein [Pelagicoccus sp. SDUM812003]|uniref:hypothetical protein n=1 Tax=Pelagicoccus sp. SDUM812003 TaxID=3041267 RepID=UPI00280E51DD|nr:hypothetical protein [Pelagicoccus sp. SDUM812003]MDQ8202566.1 hypothetical protein [Pelagicoccus sp. SDUM812003]
MISAVEKYLETLLAFVPRQTGGRFSKDYISLIHVPAHGPEKVYSLVMDEQRPLFTLAQYKETVWELVEASQGEMKSPQIDALQAEVTPDHPAFIFLDHDSVSRCETYGDGGAGLDYYLMLWQMDGESGVVECYEPYVRDNQAWLTVVGALQVLSSEFEYALQERE